MRYYLLALALCVGISGCGGGGGRDVYAGGDRVPDGASIFAIQSGVASEIGQGIAGYGIAVTANPNRTATYRVVWIGNGAQISRFTGSIYTLEYFDRFAPGCGGVCRLEEGDYVSRPIAVAGGQRIDFDTYTASGFDGIDVVTSLEPAYFELYVDGRPANSVTFFPSAAQNGQIAVPATNPFGLSFQ
jgi:hypothetical protein